MRESRWHSIGNRVERIKMALHQHSIENGEENDGTLMLLDRKQSREKADSALITLITNESLENRGDADKGGNRSMALSIRG